MIESAQEIIESAAKLAGVLGEGTSLTANEYHDLFLGLCRIIDRWNLQDLLVYAVSSHTFDFVSGKQAYTLGTGGDWDIPRPSRIERASILYSANGTNPPVELAIDPDTDLEHWQNVTVKSVQSIFPFIMYNDFGFPYMTLKFWPIPQGPAQAILYTWDIIEAPAELTSLLELPMGYSAALINNLALYACQLFDRQPSAYLVDEAQSSKHDINGINDLTSPEQHLDPMWGGRPAGVTAMFVASRGRVRL